MFNLVALIVLGIIIQVAMLRKPWQTSPRFTTTCTRCGYQIPAMEYPPALHECPACHWMDKRQ